MAANGGGSWVASGSGSSAAAGMGMGYGHARRAGSVSSTVSVGGGGVGGSGAAGARSSSGSPQTSSISSSHMESSVTRLLVATKQLLESLTEWSHGKVDEGGVSDVYVRLGNDFNAASMAFTREGIEMSDLNSVPDDLRTCLEAALSEEASPSTLDQHLPRIRQIVIHLLQGLKQKQARWRTLQSSRRQAEEQARLVASPSGSEGKDSVAGGERQPPERQNSYRAARTLSAVKSREDLRRAAAASAAHPHDGFRPPSTSGRSTPSIPPPRQTSGDPPGFGMDPSTGMPKGALPNPPKGSPGEAHPSRTELSRRRPGSGDDGTPHSRTQSGRKLSRDLGERVSGRTSRSSPPPPLPNGGSISPSGSLHDMPYRSPGQGSIPLPPPTSFVTPQISEPVPSPPLPPIPHSPPRVDVFSGPPPPPSAASSSLEALRKTDTLQRRASKRFSTYTYNRIAGSGVSPHKRGDASLGMGLTGAGNALGLGGTATAPGLTRSTSGMSIRERDETEAREVSEAGRELVRGAKSMKRPSVSRQLAAAAAASLPYDQDSPARGGADADRSHDTPSRRIPSMIQEEPEDGATTPEFTDAQENIARTPAPPSPAAIEAALPRAPLIEPPIPPTPPPEGPPTVFLQLGRDVKKAQLDGPPSVTSLRMLFMDRFQYSPGTDDFPAIYLRDPQSGVQYELEDMSEVKDRVVLSLNIDALDQVKTHIDSGLAALTRELKDLKTSMTAIRRQSVSAHSALLPHAATFGSDVGSPAIGSTDPRSLARSVIKAARPAPTSPQTKAIEEVAPDAGSALALTVPPPAPAFGTTATPPTIPHAPEALRSHIDEVRNLRRDLGVLRQVYNTFTGDTKDMISSLRSQTEAIRTVAATKVSSSRAFIDSGKGKVETRSQDLVTRVEALQDTVEDLKQDVTNRKMRPKPNAVAQVNETIAAVTAELEDLSKHIATIKPAWKRTWEEELQTIVDEQQLLNYQEELVRDLREDLSGVTTLFGHVKDYLDARKGSKLRVKDFTPQVQTATPKAGLDTVLMQVKALSPDPSARLRAIEAAEKQRQKNLTNKEDAFADELADFVGGKKLKMTGGTEETERQRQLKQEQTLKAMLNGGVPAPTPPSSLPPSSSADATPSASADSSATASPEVETSSGG